MIHRCQYCKELPENCTCDLTKDRTLYFSGGQLVIETVGGTREVRLSIGSRGPRTAKEVRDLIPTFIAWHQRLRNEFPASDIFDDPYSDPLALITKLRAEGLGWGTIAQGINDTLDRGRNASENERNFWFWYMTKTGISEERATRALEHEGPFPVGFPLDKDRLKKLVKRKTAKTGGTKNS